MRLTSKIGKHNYFNSKKFSEYCSFKNAVVFSRVNLHIRVLYNYYIINVSRRAEYDRLQGEKVLITRPLVLYVACRSHNTRVKRIYIICILYNKWNVDLLQRRY